MPTGNVRNVLIVLALSLAVFAIPGGERGATFIGALLSTAITASFAFIGYKLYRENRTDIFGLGERYRGLLYGAVAVAIFAMAARVRLFDAGGGGVLLWFAAIAGASYALVVVFRHYRSYQY